MTHCPLCQAELVSTQPFPKAMRCPNSHKGDGHLFEYLCFDDERVHSYKYNFRGLHIGFWPWNDHVVLRVIKGDRLIFGGKTTKNFVDFPKILDYLKLITVFS